MENNFFEYHKLFKNYGMRISIDGFDLPSALIDILRKNNVSSYSDGFFTFIDKSDVGYVFDLWSIPNQTAFPILKTGFGMVLFVDEYEYKLIDPIYNEVIPLGSKDDVEFLFNTLLCDRMILESTFLIDIYEAVFNKIGPPEINECYAFYPAIGLGGGLNTDSIRICNMEAELAILSQL
jgi:hypothetical protein